MPALHESPGFSRDFTQLKSVLEIYPPGGLCLYFGRLLVPLFSETAKNLFSCPDLFHQELNLVIEKLSDSQHAEMVDADAQLLRARNDVR